MPHSAQIEKWLPVYDCNLCLCFQRDNNAQKIFVGGIANGTTEDDLRNYFSAYGTVLHALFIALLKGYSACKSRSKVAPKAKFPAGLGEKNG